MKRLMITLASLIVTYIFIYPIILYFLGYYPWGVGWDVAKTIVEKDGNVYDCKKIIHPIAEPMSPTAGEQRSSCIHEYAKLTKDPSACELLMPSNYGWDCVGVAEDFDPCIMLADSNKTVKGQGIETTYEECSSDDSDAQTHVCCKMARILYENETDCTTFPEGSLKDQCHHIRGVKEIDANQCNQIENERNRTGCNVIVRGYARGGIKQ